MKILLIYPGIGVKGFRKTYSTYMANIVFGIKNNSNGEFAWIHHGLALLGAILKKEGHDVVLCDLRKQSGWISFVEDLMKINPDWVGITASYLDTDAAKTCAKLIKQNLPNCKIVVGGLSPTLDTHIWDEPFIDHIITNEGEISLPKLINGELTDRVIKGIQPELSSLPYADRDLYDYVYELQSSFFPYQPKPMITMISARGCPYQCTYCQPAEQMVFGKGTRWRSVDHVIGELKELKMKYNFKSITWWDDTFTVNKKWLKEFCQKFNETFSGIEHLVNSRADIISNDEEIVELLASIGVKYVEIGFETGSDRLLKFLKKGTTVEQNLKAAVD